MAAVPEISFCCHFETHDDEAFRGTQDPYVDHDSSNKTHRNDRFVPKMEYPAHGHQPRYDPTEADNRHIATLEGDTLMISSTTPKKIEATLPEYTAGIR